MDLDFSKRQVRLSVGELAGFALRPCFGEGAPSGAWRTAVGRQWHQQLQNNDIDAAAHHPDLAVAVEVALDARWPIAGWMALLGGRIDEVLSTHRAHLFREIKTVREALPIDPADLRERYPSYFAQLAIYVELARIHPKWNDREISGELLFVDIDEGFTQTIPLDPGEAPFRLACQSEQLGRFLTLRMASHEAHSKMTPRAPFDCWRSGQEDALEALRRSAKVAPIRLFEAPTGFGKTGLALDQALEELRSGRMDRIIFLTGKSSGQAPIVEQLHRILGDTAPFSLRYLQMRNRQELRLASGDAATFDRTAMARRWEDADLRLEDLFTGPTITPDRLLEVGERLEVDPHALARALLALTDIWIGDYNYLFAPGSAGVFRDVIGFDPAKTFLIVDEAHNLPARAAGAWSHRFQAADWHVLASELARLEWPPSCLRAVEALAGFIDVLRPSDRLDDALHFEGKALLRGLAEQIVQTPLPWEDTSEFMVDLLWRVPAAFQTLENALLPMLSWSPTPGQWSLTCLDASAETGPILQQFGGAMLMSATLQPLPETCLRLGLPDPGTKEGRGVTTLVEGQAPWRQGAHRVAIDTRVDTRFKSREASLRRTALTVLALAEGQPAPIAVFFSSYRYAEDVARFIEWEAPYLRVAMQPRSLDLPAQGDFLEESLLTAHALFLILGSSFSEGIDQLGGRIERAMVVGPALPEVNPVQEATRAAFRQAGHPDPFRATYQLPGLTRIHQALGRLVRAPGHRADILLHGQRFAEPAYHCLLRPEFQTADILRTDHDLAVWLRGNAS